jgi:hypothetical protein
MGYYLFLLALGKKGKKIWPNVSNCFSQVFFSWAILIDLQLIGCLFLARATFNKLQNFSLSPLEKNGLLYRMGHLPPLVAPR